MALHPVAEVHYGFDGARGLHPGGEHGGFDAGGWLVFTIGWSRSL
jgi:hypothetical protein